MNERVNSACVERKEGQIPQLIKQIKTTLEQQSNALNGLDSKLQVVSDLSIPTPTSPSMDKPVRSGMMSDLQSILDHVKASNDWIADINSRLQL